MIQSFLVIIIPLILFGCNSSSTSPTPQPRTSQSGADTADDSSNDRDSESEESSTEEEETDNFYEMSGERPEEVCGSAGFSYLFEGYILPECGTCHHTDNIYGVTEFAVRDDEASSYQVMRTRVNTEEFLKAVQENTLCITCNLDPEDPLLKDIEYFVEHINENQCETTSP